MLKRPRNQLFRNSSSKSVSALVPSRMIGSLETADPISTQTDGFIRSKSSASNSRASRRIKESSKTGRHRLPPCYFLWIENAGRLSRQLLITEDDACIV